MKIQFLSPVQEADHQSATLAPRLESLDGLTLGLLDNGKTNSGKLLDMIAQRLKAQFKLTEVMVERKANSSSNVPSPQLEKLVTQSDFIITGVGD